MSPRRFSTEAWIGDYNQSREKQAGTSNLRQNDFAPKNKKRAVFFLTFEQE